MTDDVCWLYAVLTLAVVSSFDCVSYSLPLTLAQTEVMTVFKDRQDRASQPTGKMPKTPNENASEPEPGWSLWQRWDNFPHHLIQMGMSNRDYGGMMDMEYACFGAVGDFNNEKKSQTYWYRLADQIERIGDEDYIQIEVGCWMDGDFKATMSVTGISLS